MSVASVDDLVASLNGNHIGNDARDLAALQAQLHESLYQCSSVHLPSSPVATRTFDFSAAAAAASRARPSRSNSMAAQPSEDDMMDVEEVEQQLLQSPISHRGPSRASSNALTASTTTMTHINTSYQHTVSPTSSFAKTDPFFASVSRTSPFARPTYSGTSNNNSAWDNHSTYSQPPRLVIDARTAR